MNLSAAINAGADRFLWNGVGPIPGPDSEGGYEYSCDAAREMAETDVESGKVEDFLTSLGVHSYSLHEFMEFDRGPERQGARYLWLKFAALVAAEQEKA